MKHLAEAELRLAAGALGAPDALEFLPLLGLSAHEAAGVHAVAQRVAAVASGSGGAAATSPEVLALVDQMADEEVAALDLLMWLAAEYLPDSSTRLAVHLWTAEIVMPFTEHLRRAPPQLSTPVLRAVEAQVRAFRANEAAVSMQRLFEAADRRDTQTADGVLFTLLAMVSRRYFARFAAGVRRVLDGADLQAFENWAGAIAGRELPLP